MNNQQKKEAREIIQRLSLPITNQERRRILDYVIGKTSNLFLRITISNESHCGIQIPHHSNAICKDNTITNCVMVPASE